MMEKEWYLIEGVELVDSPTLVLYQERIVENISRLIGMVQSPTVLRPHVKTNKSADVTNLMISQGINKFKCATIAEAEMLGMCEAKDVLLAYQPTEFKVKRLTELIQTYHKSKFSCLVDNPATAEMISDIALQAGINVTVFIDLNVGMNRTGIKPELAFDLYIQLQALPGITAGGFHAYDGHIREKDLTARAQHCEFDFAPVEQLREKIQHYGYEYPLLIAGGSPTFYLHSKRQNVECSPGTFVFWDKGYEDNIPEQNFLWAALVVSRVVSLPDETKICIDLGYKAISSENDLQNRAYFLNAPHLKPYSQSEEHMVIEVGPNHQYQIGDIFYVVPIHICPTVAMYDNAYIVHHNRLDTKWPITSRGREISI